MDAAGVFRVTDAVQRTVGSPDAFTITVSARNISTAARTAVYRRVMNWDVEPTEFDEYVTITTLRATPAFLVYDSNNGFAQTNPPADRTDLGATGLFTDYGPIDQGPLFDFDLGVIQAGQSKQLTIYDGAAPSEGAAMDARGRQLYSLGEPSGPDGAKYGFPATFFFRFRQ